MRGAVLLVAVWLWLAVLQEQTLTYKYDIGEEYYYTPMFRESAMQCEGGNIGGEMRSNHTKQCCEQLKLDCLHNDEGRNACGNKTVDNNRNKTVKDMLTCCEGKGAIQLSFVYYTYDLPGCKWWNEGKFGHYKMCVDFQKPIDKGAMYRCCGWPTHRAVPVPFKVKP